jgi:hypothetical protein
MGLKPPVARWARARRLYAAVHVLPLVVGVLVCFSSGTPTAGAANNVPAAVQCPASPHCWAGVVTVTEVIDSQLVEGCCTTTMATTNSTVVTVNGAGTIVQHESPSGATVFGGETGQGTASLNTRNSSTNARCPPDGSEGASTFTLVGSVRGDGRVLVIPDDEDHPTTLTIGAGVDTNVPTTSTEQCNSFSRSTSGPGGAFSTQAVIDVPAGWDGLHLQGTYTEHVGDYVGAHDRTTSWDLTRKLRPGCPAVSFAEVCTIKPPPAPSCNRAYASFSGFATFPLRDRQLQFDTAIRWCHDKQHAWLPSPRGSVVMDAEVLEPTALTVPLEGFLFGTHFVAHNEQNAWTATARGGTVRVVATGRIDACMPFADIVLAYASVGLSRLFKPPGEWERLPEWRRVQLSDEVVHDVVRHLPAPTKPAAAVITYILYKASQQVRSQTIQKGLSVLLHKQICVTTWTPRMTVTLNPSGKATADIGGAGSPLWGHRLTTNTNVP